MSRDEVVVGAAVYNRVVGTQVVLDAPCAVECAGGAPVASVKSSKSGYTVLILSVSSSSQVHDIILDTSKVQCIYS